MLPKDAALNLAWLILDPASHWCYIKLIQASSLIQMLDIEAATATSCKQSGVKFNHLGLLKCTGIGPDTQTTLRRRWQQLHCALHFNIQELISRELISWEFDFARVDFVRVDFMSVVTKELILQELVSWHTHIYRIHWLISAYPKLQGNMHLIPNMHLIRQKLTTPPKPRRPFGSTCTWQHIYSAGKKNPKALCVDLMFIVESPKSVRCDAMTIVGPRLDENSWCRWTVES